MAKKDKDYELRMQGMIYAYNKVKEEGLDALDRDIKMRGITRIPLVYKEADARKMMYLIGNNVTMNVLTVSCVVLNELYGFGQKRLRDFMDQFTKRTDLVVDMDYMGAHYATLDGYAVEMNEKYNLGIDVGVLATYQELSDQNNPRYHMCQVEMVIESLERDGFPEAADRLRWRMENDGLCVS